MTGTKISYVVFHGKKFVHFESVIKALQELTDGGKKVISVDKLVEWLETIEYPEQT